MLFEELPDSENVIFAWINPVNNSVFTPAPEIG